MRHNKDDKRFSRTGGHLRCMMANMTNSLILNGRIKTTSPKAKLLRSYAEKMITLGKSGSLPARRRAMAFLRDKTMVTRLFAEIAPRYAERKGGYTRIMKVGFRAGDCAPVSIIELVEADSEKKAAPRKTRSKSAAPRKKQAPAKKAASAVKADTEKKKAPAKKAAAKTTGDAKKAPVKKEAAAKKTSVKAAAKKSETTAKAKKAPAKKAAAEKKTDK